MPRQYTPDPVVDDPNSWQAAPPPSGPVQTKWDKFIHKFKEEPLVPLGASRSRLVNPSPGRRRRR